MTHTPAVEMRGITKRFGALAANAEVDLTLRVGRIHALLGENGAGKSTLSKILYGLYRPDAGSIHVYGQPAHFGSPGEAMAAGVGMVTQHFSLVPTFTVAENIILGLTNGLRLDRQAAEERVAALAKRYGLSVEPGAVVRNLAVGEQQRVEILKALYRDCRVLILDEPTAVLTPQESAALFAELKLLVAQGLSILFISHKLEEVTAHCDEVTVLRGGKVVYSGPVAGTSAAQLAQQMVGRELTTLARDPRPPGAPVLIMQDVNAFDQRRVHLLRDISLTVNAGEIVGVAGVSGNGQRELAEVLSGLRRASAGSITISGRDMTGATATQFARAGVGRIPEDRLQGIVGTMSVGYNLALEHLDEFAPAGVLDRQAITDHAVKLIREYQIKATSTDQARRLSGGNIQKIILARTLSRSPSLIVAAQPTRGLDVGATEFVRAKLAAARREGAGVLLISEDLDELLELSDRIAVMYAGRIIETLPATETTTERLGLLMGGVST
jgi:simple sugar transport system ATP-binding protein